MSDKTTKAADPEVLDEHGDELIHVPKGQSRLRYLATIGLVLFLLVIFVVADLFSTTLTGGGQGSDEIYLTWTDPVDGSPNEVIRSDFLETARTLQMMGAFGIYRPDSFQFGERDFSSQRQPETTEEDTASFLIYEDLANDVGVAVSDAEHTDFLRRVFGGKEGYEIARQRTGWSGQLLSDTVRRLQRVQKLRGMMLGMLSITDPASAVAKWSEDNPEYQFQIVEVKRADSVATAEAEILDDEALAEWFHARPPFEQQRYYTEQKSVAEVGYLSLAEGSEFDSTALLAAYPAPDGVDLDGQANSYYSQFRAARFMVEVVPDEEDQDPDEAPDEAPDETPENDPTDDGDQDVAKAEAQETPAPETRIQEFEEVEAQVRMEAPIYAALGSFLTDVQDRLDAGEEVDFAAEAAALGLSFEATNDEGSTRQDFTDNETWGNPTLASQLVFSPVDRFVPRVTVTDSAMVVARVTKKIDREEPPFADIRDDVAELWVNERSMELAVESLENVRAVLAVKPEDVELADWRPEVDVAELRQLAVDAGYTFTDRPWLGRNEIPEGQTFATMSASNQHMMSRPELYDLEPGQVAAPAASSDGESAFLIRFGEKRNKDESEIDYATVMQLRQSEMFEKTREFGAQVFLGDGEWLTTHAKVAFPTREAREAEEASETANAGEGAVGE